MIVLDKKEYANIVRQKSKNPKILEDAFISFLAGGVLGALYHVLTVWVMDLFNIDATIASGYVCALFIVIAIILTGFRVFDNLVAKFKFGLIIPITGFAHSVASSLLDYKKDGLITGMGSNMFKLAGAVILYGLISAFFCTIIKVIIYG